MAISQTPNRHRRKTMRTLCAVTIDPRTPVIIGAAQVSQRPPADDDLVNAPDPIDLMTLPSATRPTTPEERE
jgi:hypothetical protein